MSGAAEGAGAEDRDSGGVLAAASTSAVSATATEVVREVVMAGTIGAASNRPATGDQRGANASVLSSR